MKQNSAVAGRRQLASAASQLDLFQPPRKATRALTTKEKYLADLAAYRRTVTWKRKRSAKLAQTRGQCERCGSWTGRKDIHHKVYPKRPGDERLEDLIVVCTRRCHPIEDERRAAEAKRRAENALEDARIEGFARSKYGESWRESGLCSDVAEEYGEWLEGRDGY